MKINQLLKNTPLPYTETEILLSFLLHKDRSFLLGFPETHLTSGQKEIFSAWVERRKQKEPLAYILGFKEFFGRNFFVNKNVLIPRPETENLIEKALDQARNLRNPRIIDVGTGSGCIAITLAKELPEAKITATDICGKALATARRNAKFHGVSSKIKFLQTNLLERVDGQFDLILANLPYIPAANYEKLPAEIKEFEPKKALLSFDNPMKFYELLFEQAKTLLTKNGKTIYELDGEIFEKTN